MLPSLRRLPGGGKPYTLTPLNPNCAPADSPVVLADEQGAQGRGPPCRVPGCTTPLHVWGYSGPADSPPVQAAGQGAESSHAAEPGTGHCALP